MVILDKTIYVLIVEAAKLKVKFVVCRFVLEMGSVVNLF
jgi:hypothetical protein